MKKSTYVILFITGLITFLSFCRQTPPLTEDPIATLGHGSVLDKQGNEVRLTEAFIRQIQDLYILQLSGGNLSVRDSSIFDENRIRERKDLIYGAVEDKVLANALFIEWLIEQRKPKNESQFSTVNNALRWYYVLNIQKNPLLPGKDKKWSKGIPDQAARKLEENGVIVYAITNSGMEAYCEECLEAGVPVPRNMFGNEWVQLGSFDNEFISTGNQAELMIYVSTDPEGFCLALPRYEVSGTSVGNEAKLFGVICLGTRTSKACFFDNPRGTYFRRDETIDFRSNFLGGTDLVLNGQGTCSDCHAGENPFIIHPEKEPFEKILDHVSSTMPLRWHDPIVPGTWPNNPGPTYVLNAISSPGACNSCHRQGSAGRFPDLSFPLPGYCTDVLTQAVRPVASGGTMPPYGMDRSLFVSHINALQSYCGLTSEDGKLEEVVIPEDRSFISPPIVIGPLYACATNVLVRGAVLDAKVTLSINGMDVATIDPARNPDQIEFGGLPALTATDVVTARQEVAGAISAPSDPVTVRNYRDDYPGGVPQPVIDPVIIYECADIIAVRHLQGSIITVYTNGINPRSFTSGGDWTAIPPSGAPFNVNDEFTVQVSLCGDNSPMSAPVRARRAPMVLANPAFNPANIYTGQELLTIEDITYGARVNLNETTSGWSGNFSTPITWYSNYDIKTAMGRPLQSGDNLQATQSLCAVTSDSYKPGRLHNCELLPAPYIERPIEGNRFVIVSRSVPGARVMVYDASGTELGDGSGTVIMLRRAIIAGEIITVTQRVGECTSRFVYRVRASGKEQ